MSSDSKVTGGPWRIDKRCLTRIVSGEDNTVASTGNQSDLIDSWVPNASLIVAAVNSCFTVSPSDPQLAAEAYPDIVNVLLGFRIRLHFVGMPGEPMHEGRPDWRKEIKALDAALAKVGR